MRHFERGLPAADCFILQSSGFCMYWNSFSDFLHMGGYGLYVWGSFGMAALVMAVETWLAIRQARIIRQRLARQVKLSLFEAERQREEAK
ncbi:MAG: heme exporter protein CcmD [Betaproteobacteria bacterium]|nr:heme exporter protein CcmD [Betaproteobacteria bacterium]